MDKLNKLRTKFKKSFTTLTKDDFEELMSTNEGREDVFMMFELKKVASSETVSYDELMKKLKS